MNKKLAFILSLVLLASILVALPVYAAEKSAGGNVTAEQYEKMVRETLDTMTMAYEQKELRKFMKLVSADFVGDDFLMYRAVRRDFRFFDNIDLSLNIDSFAVNRKGEAQVAVKYNRFVIANTDGRSYKDSGLTQMTFHIEDGQAKLYDMKFPIIFGLSEGMQIASGIVRTTETSQVLTLDRRGSVNVLPFRDAVRATNSVSVTSGTFSLISNGAIYDNFTFATRTKTSAASFIGDIANGGAALVFNGTEYQELSPGMFDFTTSVPTGGYTTAPTFVMLLTAVGSPPTIISIAGKVYALHLTSGKYALIEITSVSGPTGGYTTVTFRYKYQPSGSNTF